MKMLELAQTHDGLRVIEAVVGDVLDEVKLTAGAYLEAPETWERFVGLAAEAMYAGQTLTPLLVALGRGELADRAADEGEEALAAIVRPVLHRVFADGFAGLCEISLKADAVVSQQTGSI
jgi:hypothetical protein